MAGSYQRTPETIDRIIEQVREAWQRDPEQRLGQLLLNLARVPEGFRDLWEVRDEEWQRLLSMEAARK